VKRKTAFHKRQITAGKKKPGQAQAAAHSGNNRRNQTTEKGSRRRLKKNKSLPERQSFVRKDWSAGQANLMPLTQKKQNWYQEKKKRYTLRAAARPDEAHKIFKSQTTRGLKKKKAAFNKAPGKKPSPGKSSQRKSNLTPAKGEAKPNSGKRPEGKGGHETVEEKTTRSTTGTRIPPARRGYLFWEKKEQAFCEGKENHLQKRTPRRPPSKIPREIGKKEATWAASPETLKKGGRSQEKEKKKGINDIQDWTTIYPAIDAKNI